MNPTTYFVTLNWNTTGLLSQMITSVETTVSGATRWVIVDNGSNAERWAALRAFAKAEFVDPFILDAAPARRLVRWEPYLDEIQAVVVRSRTNLGCIEGHNLALNVVKFLSVHRPHEVVLINTDVVISEHGWLDRLHSWLEDKPQIGIVGLEHSRGAKCASAIFLDTNGNWYIQGDQRMHAIPVESESVGFGMVMLRWPVLEAGLRFDPRFVMYYKQDDDFAFQVRTMGLEVWAFPIDCLHWGSGSLKTNEYHVGDAQGRAEFEQVKQANQRRFAEKWAWALRERRGSWEAEMGHLAEMRRVMADRRH